MARRKGEYLVRLKGGTLSLSIVHTCSHYTQGPLSPLFYKGKLQGLQILGMRTIEVRDRMGEGTEDLGHGVRENFLTEGRKTRCSAD